MNLSERRREKQKKLTAKSAVSHVEITFDVDTWNKTAVLIASEGYSLNLCLSHDN